MRPLARVACALTNGRRWHSDQQWALSQFLAPELLQKSSIDLKSESWVFISRRQLHLTYLLLATYGDRTHQDATRSLLDPADRFEFGELLLHVSSFLGDTSTKRATAATTARNINPFQHESRIAVQLLRTAKSDQPISADTELIRGHRLLFHYLPKEYQRDGRTIDALAASCYDRLQCEPQDLWRLAASVLLANYQQSGLTLKTQPGLSRSVFFKNFRWDEVRVDRTLNALTTSLDQLAWEFSQGSHRFLTCIDKKPLLQLSDDHIILDFTSLACFLGSGIFDLIADSLHHDERQHFREYLGLALEAYARDIADAAAKHSKSGSVVTATKENHPGHDFRIQDNLVLAALEVKADSLKADYLTADTSLIFSNMIMSSKVFTKAHDQLAKSFKSLVVENKNLTRLHLGVIVLDDAFAFMYVQQAFNEKFRKLFKDVEELKSKHFVRPFVASLREWEQICTLVASGRRFVDCFDAIVNHDPIGEYTIRMSLDWKDYVVTSLSDTLLDEAFEDVFNELASVLSESFEQEIR
ncbi:MAG: hypothetical protein IT363_10225 [Methanoregulaceae archaeon]|nr:hypothetical protein [Methanoregulaceae archaeon]